MFWHCAVVVVSLFVRYGFLSHAIFIQVVEQSSSETQQAESLNLLLTLIRQNPEHAIDFEIMSGPQMLSKILVTKQCIIGFPILRVSNVII